MLKIKITDHTKPEHRLESYTLEISHRYDDYIPKRWHDKYANDALLPYTKYYTIPKACSQSLKDKTLSKHLEQLPYSWEYKNKIKDGEIYQNRKSDQSLYAGDTAEYQYYSNIIY